MSLLFGGTFSKFADIQVRLHQHAGGPLPVLAARLEQQMRHPEFAARIPNGLPYELKKLHYEVANSTISAPAMAAITALVPPSQLLFGTDFPYVAMEKTCRRSQRARLCARHVACHRPGQCGASVPAVQDLS